jgi:hypothetical protein
MPSLMRAFLVARHIEAGNGWAAYGTMLLPDWALWPYEALVWPLLVELAQGED